MGIHEFNNNSLPDTEFANGELKYIVKNNRCRLLDGRRTPGYIEDYFEDTAMFRWRITDFEDKGNYWDVPAEDINMFQILNNSQELQFEDWDKISKKCQQFGASICIEGTEENKKATEEKIAIAERNIIQWFHDNLSDEIVHLKIDQNSKEGNDILINAIKRFMSSLGLIHIEEKTTCGIVLNLSSEWIKAIKIILAELGIVCYKNKVLRQASIFDEVGGKERATQYIINRIAFVRAYFKLLNIGEVVLYRGMATEKEWFNYYDKSITSWTFDLEVAMSFGDLSKASANKNGYVFKRLIPIENIFMTYLETEAMNKQYKESEAILFFNAEMGYY